MKIHHFPQYSPEWWAIRRGKVTASEVGPFLLGDTKVAKKARARLIGQKIGEIAGIVEDSYSNDAIKRGSALESFARASYERATGHNVTEVGFVEHEAMPAGSSPDGVVFYSSNGLVRHPVEIKCPETSAKHVQWLLADEVPDEHEFQCHMHMLLTGASYCDFMSYYPVATFIKTRYEWTVDTLEEGPLPPFIKRVHRSALTSDLDAGLCRFFAEFQAAKTVMAAKWDAHVAKLKSLTATTTDEH